MQDSCECSDEQRLLLGKNGAQVKNEPVLFDSRDD
jgi:hypothetical protein